MPLLSPKTKALLVALGIFTLGVVCGALGHHYLLETRRPSLAEGFPRAGPPRADRLLDLMTNRLHLTNDQREEIGRILAESREEIGEIRAQIRGQMQSLEAVVREKIGAVLTEEQREKYETTMPRRERRRLPDHQRGPPDGR